MERLMTKQELTAEMEYRLQQHDEYHRYLRELQRTAQQEELLSEILRQDTATRELIVEKEQELFQVLDDSSRNGHNEETIRQIQEQFFALLDEYERFLKEIKDTVY